MKASKRISFILAGIGLLLAAFTVWLSFSSRNAEPKLVRYSEDAGQCIQTMLDAVCIGDYASAGQRIYGSPSLTSGAETQSESGKLLWDALISSLSYEWVGEPYASLSGVSQDIRLTALKMDSVTSQLKEASMNLLTQRVQEAEDVSEIYDADGSYQEGFVMEVLRDATEQVIEKDAVLETKELTLTAVYEQGSWWVLPNQMLIEQISGGIMKQ